MNVLLIGSGGREAALEWALQASPLVGKISRMPDSIYAADCVWCQSSRFYGVDRIVRFAKSERVDLVVVGPERPLVAGIADALQKANISVFGPSKRAAELEGSKVAAKLFCKAYGIPTADFDIAETPEQAKVFVRRRGVPIVVKADGLMSGKGVKVVFTPEKAFAAIDEFSKLPMGRRLVIEERLVGWECSYVVLTDGMYYVPLPPVEDYKETEKGSGIMTGGMGCRTIPRNEFTPEMERRAQQIIIEPTLARLRDEGRPFTGALYAGLMMVGSRPYVLEFNCRLGDPETQTALPLVREGMNIAPYLHAAANGSMRYRISCWKERHAVCVILAAEGYPDPKKLRAGDVIYGMEEVAQMEGVYVFPAGMRYLDNGAAITTDGRVLSITAVATSPAQARTRAYAAVKKIYFRGMWYREDIGL